MVRKRKAATKAAVEPSTLTRGLIVSAEARSLDRQIGVDWRDFLKGLTKLAIGAWTLSPGAIEGAAEVIAALRPEATAEEQAWHLIRRSLGRAMAELTVEAVQAANIEVPETIVDLVETLDDRLEGVAIELEPSFLDQPKALPVLVQMDIAFTAFLARLGIPMALAAATGSRLPSYFAMALDKIRLTDHETYALLWGALQHPLGAAAMRERAWRFYARSLDQALDRPILQGPASLRQLYQPLRAYLVESPRRTQDGRKEHREEKPTHHVVDLAAAMDEWVDRADHKEALRVICGGPGSGKSSFAQVWGARRAAEANPPTLLVPLHLVESDDIRDEIGRIARSRGLTENPLDDDRGEPRLLLLLDGLDELAMQGETGLGAAEQLLKKLLNLLALKNHLGPKLQLVIGGREMLVDRLQSQLEERQVFHVLPYAVSEDEKAKASWVDPAKLLADDQRAEWWHQWGKLTGEPNLSLPEEVAKNKPLEEISRQPLLNHLLARVRKRGKIQLTAKTNLNAIYADILVDVWQRSWGRHDREGNPRLAEHQELEPDDFNRLFETIGLVMWQGGGGRTVTLAQVEAAVLAEKLEGAIKAFERKAKDGALSLLTAFFFREAGQSGRGDPSFELTHKSFGEYLAARRLVRAIEELHDDANRPRAKLDVALGDWVKLTGEAPLTMEILGFLRREVSTRDRAVIAAWQASLVRLFNENLRQGMPAHIGATSLIDATRRAANAEEALLAAVNACARLSLMRVGMEWNSITYGVASLVARLGPNEGRESPVFDNCFDLLNIGAHRYHILARDYGYDPRYRIGYGFDRIYRLIPTEYMLHRNIRFRGLNLEGAHIDGADLQDVFLEDAQCSQAHLNGAKLTRARLARADLTDAHLVNAMLDGANLAGARLARALLSGANLSGAVLFRADLHEANLHEANLDGANLHEANLHGANLHGANLDGTNLDGAKLVGAKLNGADLSGVDLRRTRGLTRAQLARAKSIEGAKLPKNLPDE